MIRISTPSRLHFGLFSLPTAGATTPRRQFGGVGLMVDQPGIKLSVAFAKNWSANGPLADRALGIAQKYCASVGIKDAFDLQFVAAAPEHTGLGTGTQLALAVARAIAELTQQPSLDAVTLATQVGRGKRSALGIHGFDHGGFLVEGGKTVESAISPLLIRREFPKDWNVLLITPSNLQGTHGRREIEMFADLATCARNDRTTDALCRLVLLGMVPAMIERDLPTFGEALYDFNRLVGEMFQPVQGGVYAHLRIEELIKTLRDAGIKGVAQSSWGPTIAAVVASERATEMRDRLIRKIGIAAEEILVTAASNHGALLFT